MSQISAAAEHAKTVDWNVVAAAIAVFFGTVVTTILGGLKARNELNKKLSTNQDGSVQVQGAILQDNQTVREATMVSKELRDQLLLGNHAMDHLTRSIDESTGVNREILAELRLMRSAIDSFGSKG